MSSILIVDDEYYLVQGVKSSLDWEALGITQIYEAYSAEQARKIYEQYSVDILLADVEMPKESGLALIKWIKENGYHSINLLLTGHADFNYAQSAIGLQVYRYILKPADINELTAALEEGYRNQLLKGRFPGCVLEVLLPVTVVGWAMMWSLGRET